MFIYFIKEIDKYLDDMLERGVIELFNSLWLVLVVLFKKDGLYCFCIDY